MDRLLFLGLCIYVLGSCASQQSIRSWQSSEDLLRSFDKIAVFGMANSTTIRTELESEIVSSARKQDINAVNGMSLFPPELGKPFEDIERVKSRLKEKAFDAIMTVAIIDESAPRYIKPETTYEPLLYYDRFRNYYYKTYALVYRPGYFSTSSRYFLETNFYELSSGELIWSGRSRVFEAVEFESYLTGYAKRLFRELKAANTL